MLHIITTLCLLFINYDCVSFFNKQKQIIKATIQIKTSKQSQKQKKILKEKAAVKHIEQQYNK